MKQILIKKNIFIQSSVTRTLLAFMLLLMSVSIMAQKGPNTKISIDLRNVSVETVLEQIEKTSNFRFIYNKNLVDVSRKVSVSIKKESVHKVLGELFTNTNITYSIQGRQIVLSKKTISKVICDVGGVIFDEKGETMIGVTILVEGTTQGTVSDIDGNFNLKAPAGSVLQISSIGYITQRVEVKKTGTLNITMKEDQQVLDEVVVVGYGTVSRKNLTTSISTVKPESLNKAATSNISQLLLGRASGLQATIASPQPDGKVNMSIRGGGNPLYVVDGVVMPNDALEVGAGNTAVPLSINRSGLTSLNPGDIESIEILKDASASIYGIGASDGVILITTKKGKTGKPTITYEGSWSTIRNQPYIEMLNAREYMEVNNAYNKENYLLSKEMYPYGDIKYDGKWSPIYSKETIGNNQYDVNWTDWVLRSGAMANQNLTITGGSDKIQYYLGMNYYKHDGTVVNSDMEKYALHTNISTQLFPFLKLTTVINYSRNCYTNSTVGSDSGGGAHAYGALQAALSYSPLLSVYEENGEFTQFRNIANPLSLQTINDRTDVNTFFSNFTVDVDIIKNMLSVKLLYGANSENSKRSLYIPSDVFFNEMYRSRGNMGNSGRLRQTIEGTFFFRRGFGDFLNMDIVAGMGLYLESYDGLSVYYENTNDQIGNDKIEIAEGPFYPSSYKGKNERRSQFIRGNFDFGDRYVVTATLRRDGTDKFFPGKKYGLFPSVSLAWKISNESFLEDVSWINLLKLRASYGLTGRDNLGTSLYGLYKVSDGNYVKFDSNSTQYVPFILSGRDYDDVTWEKTSMKNIGLDFSILKDRIWGSFDLYRYDETDMLSYDMESWICMFGKRPVNGGHYKRIGFDISLNTMNVKDSNFQWTSVLNLSRYQSVWVNRVDNYDYKIYQRRKNEPRSHYYYYKHTGIINVDRSNMPESQKSLPASAQMPGYPILKDKNGDNMIDENDIYLDDSASPKLYAGFGNTFTYKGFDLDIFMYGRFGIRKWNRGLSFGDTSMMVDTNPRNVGVSIYDSFNSLTNPNGTRPGIAYAQGPTLPGGVGVDIDVKDASFLRIRNITLGYTLNKKMLKIFSGYINTLRVYADIQNPFLFTKFPVVDPEIETGGGASTNSAYPQTRTYSFGVKLVF